MHYQCLSTRVNRWLEKKICPIFQKVVYNSIQAQKCQNTYNKVQFETSKYLHQTPFVAFKYLQQTMFWNSLLKWKCDKFTQ
jgi:hypothetical protein